jgi:hypothetical protein
VVRILRAQDPFQYKTLQRGNPPQASHGQLVSGDANVQQLAIVARMRNRAAKAYARVPWSGHSKIPRS